LKRDHEEDELDQQLKQSEHSIRASEAEVQRWEQQIEEQLTNTVTIQDIGTDDSARADGAHGTVDVTSTEYYTQPFANGEPGEVPFHEMVDLQNKLASAGG
jgi:hypothetical protein